MGNVVFILLIVAMAATLGVLFFGVFSMARGDDFNRRNANKLMRLRVVLQGCAILLFLLFVLLARG
ncbi:MAG: twin transmembrane helix small protein [Rhodospirillaceae bacterium]|nr:twin transmembrane helix small protein [Rhodospirillaceae bacterium]